MAKLIIELETGTMYVQDAGVRRFPTVKITHNGKDISSIVKSADIHLDIEKEPEVCLTITPLKDNFEFIFNDCHTALL